MVGAQFFRCDGADTFSLADLSVPGTRVWDDSDPTDMYWDCNYMIPGIEYIREFETGVLKQKKAYTYVSEEYLVDNFASDEKDPTETIADYRWAIGWWENDTAKNILTAISKGQTDKKLDDASITFNNSLCFIGQFGKNHAIRLVSNGEVKVNTFAFESNRTPYPIFGNQLPVDIDLTDIAVPGTRKWDNSDPTDMYWDCAYMVPGLEYIRLFNTTVLSQRAAYTYVSEEYIVDNFASDEPEPDDIIDQYRWAIGWWKNDTAKNILSAISKYKGGEYPAGLVRKGEEIIKAGRGFVGQFGTSRSLKFIFPSAIDLPSKK